MSKLREKILNADDIQKELVEVEEWGVTLEVRGLTGRERSKLLDDCKDKKGEVVTEKLLPNTLIAACYDPETGEKLFEPGDRDMINTKAAKALEKVVEVAFRLSGLGDKAKEEAEKN